MLYLGVTENLDEYYQKFEGIIKQKKLNWEKFIYIKRLFKFYKATKDIEELEEKKIY